MSLRPAKSFQPYRVGRLSSRLDEVLRAGQNYAPVRIGEFYSLTEDEAIRANEEDGGDVITREDLPHGAGPQDPGATFRIRGQNPRPDGTYGYSLWDAAALWRWAKENPLDPLRNPWWKEDWLELRHRYDPRLPNPRWFSGLPSINDTLEERLERVVANMDWKAQKIARVVLEAAESGQGGAWENDMYQALKEYDKAWKAHDQYRETRASTGPETMWGQAAAHKRDDALFDVVISKGRVVRQVAKSAPTTVKAVVTRVIGPL